jgi:hypothetical protein
LKLFVFCLKLIYGNQQRRSTKIPRELEQETEIWAIFCSPTTEEYSKSMGGIGAVGKVR